jgi:hypothetical protein
MGIIRPFEEILDRIHMGKNQQLKASDNRNKNIYKHREITLHSFRGTGNEEAKFLRSPLISLKVYGL